jgi:NitT/TauT family transport system permease protein
MNTKILAVTDRVLNPTNGRTASKPVTKQRRIVRKLPVQAAWNPFLIVAAQLAILGVLIMLWEIAADIKIINPFFWSQPSAIWSTLIIFLTQGGAVTDIVYTFRSTILGFIFGTMSGALLGMSFWWSVNYARIMQPYIVCLESIPKLALAPLIVLVFGMGLASKVAIAVALTIVVTTLTTYAGVRSVDKDQERLFYSIGASRWQVFSKLVIPSCIPWIISILRVNIGLALTGSIVGEFVASEHGLGRTILYAGSTYEISLVWVAVLVLAALSMVMYAIVGWAEKLLRRGIDR